MTRSFVGKYRSFNLRIPAALASKQTTVSQARIAGVLDGWALSPNNLDPINKEMREMYSEFLGLPLDVCRLTHYDSPSHTEYTESR